MYKVFISGRISGVDNYNKEAFNKAEKFLHEQGYAVMNPQRLHDDEPDNFSHDDYIRICYSMIDVCNAVYFLKGWNESVGARKEFAYARTLDKVLLYEV